MDARKRRRIPFLVATIGVFACLYHYRRVLKQDDAATNIETVWRQSLSKTKHKSFTNMTMDERRQFVRKRCYELSKMEKKPTKGRKEAYVHIDIKHHLLGCETQKVGSSTIVKFLLELNGLKNIMRPNDFRNHVLLHDLLPDIINIFPYISYMFVREPIDRLFSAYKDNRGLLNINGTLMPFEHFLTDIANNEFYTISNEHYMSFYERCRPCEVNYQYFGTMETYSDDLKFIFQKANINTSVIPHFHALNILKKINPTEVVKNLPLKIKQGLWERYQNDYYIFGFEIPWLVTD